MSRMLTISVVLGSFLAVPALCMGGVITHACECDSEFPCMCGTGCEHESECGHEGGCPDDPCGIRTVRSERQRDDFATVSQSAVPTTIILMAVTRPLLQVLCSGMLEWLGGSKLPFPSSDLPLLI